MANTLLASLRSLNSLKLPTVIVSTKTGASIKGALVDQRRDGLILRAASVANIDGATVTWHALDGDVNIPIDNVEFWQDGLPSDLLDTLADREQIRQAGGK